MGDAHFVVLDNIHYRGNGRADPSDFRGDGGYEARIGRQQLAWLRNDLRHVPKDRLVFLAMHAPLESYTGEAGNPRTNTVDRRDLFQLLSGRPNLYAVAGHTHTTEHHYFDAEDGFPGPGEIATAGKMATPAGNWFGFIILQTQRNQIILASFFFRVPIKGDRQRVAGRSGVVCFQANEP